VAASCFLSKQGVSPMLTNEDANQIVNSFRDSHKHFKRQARKELLTKVRNLLEFWTWAQATAIFHPLTRENGRVIEAQPNGPSHWSVGRIPRRIKGRIFDNDVFQQHKNAPEWVKNWDNGFWIEIKFP
jgi:hypothetical protein